MRNLIEHPVEKHEIIELLISILDDYHEQAKRDAEAGSMHMLLLSEAIRIIEEYKDYEFSLEKY